MEKKGTVTPLSSVFPAEEAQKASERVEDTIAEHRRQLEQLQRFTDDNVNLINLIGRLPDETQHNIMVPFGKAAFFPGRLIHTNELMVLLGEGYYADRSAKQTIDILKRRGKILESQVESVKAIIQDLKAEASFFDATAYESAEGLVEIREDYVEEDSSGTSATTAEVDDRSNAIEDEEYERIFSRIAELEKEEETAEADEFDANEPVKHDLENSISKLSIDQESRSSPINFTDNVGTPEAPMAPMVSKDVPLRREHPIQNGLTANKSSEQPKEKNAVQDPLTPSNTAFTGSIVEHDHNIRMRQQQIGARSSKPVSRFKMQRK